MGNSCLHYVATVSYTKINKFLLLKRSFDYNKRLKFDMIWTALISCLRRISIRITYVEYFSRDYNKLKTRKMSRLKKILNVKLHAIFNLSESTPTTAHCQTVKT